MKHIVILILMVSGLNCFAQDHKISTIDFVQILDGNKQEAMFYYENNWKQLRTGAKEKGYIDSFSFIVSEPSLEQAFEIMLITTYATEQQYELREEHFQELIKAAGGLKLLNDKKPGEFRKTLFSRERATVIDK